MRKKESEEQALIAFYTAEAKRLMGGPSDWHRRLFEFSATVGREQEPAGLMAGRSRTK